MLTLAQEPQFKARIKLIGVGGAGGNTVSFASEFGIEGVELIAVNTDAQHLQYQVRAPEKIQIGVNITRGLGAGGDPEIGRKAAEESREEIKKLVQDADMVFIACGQGGGTGTGASPVIAKEAKEAGALVVAVVTKPWLHEGPKKMKIAERGIEELSEIVDTLICIPNEKINMVFPQDQNAVDSLRAGNIVLFNAIKGIAELVTKPGLINLDFADVRAVMTERGKAILGLGISEGENRAVQAAQAAISSPLLDNISLSSAKGILINISGSDVKMKEVSDASSLIMGAINNHDVNAKIGLVVDESLNNKIQILVVATGITDEPVESRIEFGLRTENIELPTFKRREPKKETKEKAYNPNDLEVPTFLRRQVD
ncbi:MAG: cell division protein FtsZ [candidate division WOR-3 bacterium]|nr:cell division protein FtsZ [candidate division WOR-3 bacterium]